MQNTSFSRISLIAIAAVVLVAGSVANAELIDTVSGTLGGGWFYNGPDTSEGPTSEIALSMPYENGVVSFDSGFWFVENATLSWTGSKLDLDSSTGGVADATFLSGGTITLTGDIWDYFGDGLLAMNEVLFTGTVNEVRYFEQFNTNNLILASGQTRLNITGGYLASNPYGIEMSGLYTVSVPITGANQSYGELKDFQDDIWATGGGLSGFQSIPEPGTSLLLACGLGMFLRRRSR